MRLSFEEKKKVRKTELQVSGVGSSVLELALERCKGRDLSRGY